MQKLFDHRCNCPAIVGLQLYDKFRIRSASMCRLILQASVRQLSSRALERNAGSLRLRPWDGTTGRTSEGTNPNNRLLTKQIKDLATSGQFEEAHSVFTSIAIKDTILYGCMINAATICGRGEQGLSYFQEMREATVAPDATVFSAVMKLLGRQGKLAEAENLWCDMSAKGIDPWSNMSCFVGLLNAAASVGNIEAVEDRIRAASAAKRPLNRAVFGCLIKACREAQQPERALKVLQEMRARGTPANIQEYTLAMGACARALANNNDLSKAQEYVAKLHEAMALDSVSRNEYFLEEEVGALLGNGNMGDWMKREDAQLPDPDRLDAVFATLSMAQQEGIGKTALLRKVTSKVRTLQRAIFEHVPTGWECAKDPASGRLYYWRSSDPTRKTTWDIPQDTS